MALSLAADATTSRANGACTPGSGTNSGALALRLVLGFASGEHGARGLNSIACALSAAPNGEVKCSSIGMACSCGASGTMPSICGDKSLNGRLDGLRELSGVQMLLKKASRQRCAGIDGVDGRADVAESIIARTLGLDGRPGFSKAPSTEY